MKQWIGGALLGAMVIVLGPGCKPAPSASTLPADTKAKMEEMMKAQKKMGGDKPGGGPPGADK